ncbi:long-chain-fatty-acid-CoA ligase [Geomicrobium sp. JCM 19039]|nr:AMP-binding protein [Geomicrobium sp. JCM 19039]GAK13646.1 long-chain-fatty-acid-CoA ligase [Geomicrobium sp. JCM 19039]
MLTKAWLTHYPDGVPERVDVPDISVDALLKQSATQFGEHTAIIDDGRKMTYAELDQQVDQFAAALHARGLQKGDPVLLMLPNAHEYILSYYAILRMGAIVVQVNPMYQSQELAHMISIVHPRLFIGETKQRTKISKYNIPSIYIDGENETEDLSTIIHNADTYQDVTTEIIPAEDVAVIQFTGGTTGVPKGAMLTHANLVANVIQTFAFAKGTLVRPGEVFLGVSPFFHVLGMSSVMNQGIYAAATIVTMRRWRVKDGVRLINEHQRRTFPPSRRCTSDC